MIRAFRLMAQRKGTRRIAPLLWVAIGVCVTALILLIGTPERLFANPLLTALAGACAVLFVILAALLLALPSLRRRAARNTLALNPNFEGPIIVSFDADEFRHRTDFSSAAYPWDKLYGWRTDERVIIVQPAPQLFFALPCAVLDQPARAVLEAGLATTRRGRLDV